MKEMPLRERRDAAVAAVKLFLAPTVAGWTADSALVRLLFDRPQVLDENCRGHLHDLALRMKQDALTVPRNGSPPDYDGRIRAGGAELLARLEEVDALLPQHEV